MSLAKDLSSILRNFKNKLFQVIPIFNFQSLGYAYCPVTEQRKCHYLLQPNGSKTLVVEGARFLIPNSVKYFKDKSYNYRCLSCNLKDEYEKSRTDQYGFEANVKLIVSVSSNGKWSRDDKSSNRSTIVSVLFEKRICSLQIDTPDDHVTEDFIREMTALPDKYQDDTAEKFKQFFGKYGTHLVVSQNIGGFIKVDCNVEEARYTANSHSEVTVKAEGIIKKLIAGGSYSRDETFKQLNEVGVTSEQILIRGGNPPMISSLRFEVLFFGIDANCIHT
jgi:hypothetical protein